MEELELESKVFCIDITTQELIAGAFYVQKRKLH